MDADTAQTRLLDAAEELFNEHGIQAVGMDTIRARSGVSLKRLYQLYPAKDRLVEAVLTRRDHTVLTDLRRYVDARTDPRERVLAVFDFLEEWFACSDFRGCTFINTFGELGGISGDVAEIARTHKDAFRRYLRGLVADAGSPRHWATSWRSWPTGRWRRRRSPVLPPSRGRPATPRASCSTRAAAGPARRAS